jgi:hypothetical protein
MWAKMVENEKAMMKEWKPYMKGQTGRNMATKSIRINDYRD